MKRYRSKVDFLATLMYLVIVLLVDGAAMATSVEVLSEVFPHAAILAFLGILTIPVLVLLFLLPVPWTGPVIAPVIVSLGLVLTAVLIIKIEASREHFSPGWMISSLTLIAWSAPELPDSHSD